MRFRGTTIRRKIVALLLIPLVSLTAIWAFAATLTGREVWGLLDIERIVNDVGYPTEDAVQALQQERRAAILYLADPRRSDFKAGLAKQEAVTDKVFAKLRTNAFDSGVRSDLSGEAKLRLDAVTQGFEGLPALRAKVDGQTITRNDAFGAYNTMVDPCYDFLDSLSPLNNVSLDRQGRALIVITRAREAISREDALMAAAISAGRMSPQELRSFTFAVGEERDYYDDNLKLLPEDERSLYDEFWRGAIGKALRSAEDSVIAAGAAAAPRAADRASWLGTATTALSDLDRIGVQSGDLHKKRAEPYALKLLILAAVAGGLGLIAVFASLFVSVRIGRSLIRDLSGLRKEAQEVSGTRLPRVMRRLAAGEKVDVETEVPRLEYTDDEIGQVGKALNTLQRAAVEAAVRQSDMRRGVSDVFVNLARRSQVLLHRQLTLLDAMERRTEDTEELADLFRLDHMTTRMRRHAEGLVILSGAAPSRQWRKPIQLMDVVRAAVAEVEDYERIEVRRLPRLAVAGSAVADVTHLVAELIENAAVFSRRTPRSGCTASTSPTASSWRSTTGASASPRTRCSKRTCGSPRPPSSNCPTPTASASSSSAGSRSGTAYVSPCACRRTGGPQRSSSSRPRCSPMPVRTPERPASAGSSGRRRSTWTRPEPNSPSGSGDSRPPGARTAGSTSRYRTSPPNPSPPVRTAVTANRCRCRAAGVPPRSWSRTAAARSPRRPSPRPAPRSRPARRHRRRPCCRSASGRPTSPRSCASNPRRRTPGPRCGPAPGHRANAPPTKCGTGWPRCSAAGSVGANTTSQKTASARTARATNQQHRERLLRGTVDDRTIEPDTRAELAP